MPSNPNVVMIAGRRWRYIDETSQFSSESFLTEEMAEQALQDYVHYLETGEDLRPRRVPPPNVIFVFGSNEAGVHGAGAALDAANFYGAKRGIGAGPMGQSYAIPTKDNYLRVLPLDIIRASVELFLVYAARHPELDFQVTAIGTGYAGYDHKDIAPMFKNHLKNVHLPLAWKGLV